MQSKGNVVADLQKRSIGNLTLKHDNPCFSVTSMQNQLQDRRSSDDNSKGSFVNATSMHVTMTNASTVK